MARCRSQILCMGTKTACELQRNFTFHSHVYCLVFTNSQRWRLFPGLTSSQRRTACGRGRFCRCSCRCSSSPTRTSSSVRPCDANSTKSAPPRNPSYLARHHSFRCRCVHGRHLVYLQTYRSMKLGASVLSKIKWVYSYMKFSLLLKLFLWCWTARLKPPLPPVHPCYVQARLIKLLAFEGYLRSTYVYKTHPHILRMGKISKNKSLNWCHSVSKYKIGYTFF